MNKSEVLELLDRNITKTMGCTDIGVVGYIASIGAYVLKDKKISDLELKISELMGLQPEKKALYLKGSNLDDKLYK